MYVSLIGLNPLSSDGSSVFRKKWIAYKIIVSALWTGNAAAREHSSHAFGTGLPTFQQGRETMRRVSRLWIEVSMIPIVPEPFPELVPKTVTGRWRGPRRG